VRVLHVDDEPGFVELTAEGGTGFGLAIVREIVDAHGWEIADLPAPREAARQRYQGT